MTLECYARHDARRTWRAWTETLVGTRLATLRGMATEYRFTVKTDDHRTRYQTAPTFKVVVKRSTARTRYGALAEIYAQAVRMLESNAPVGREATAWIEVYDGKSAPRTLAKFAPLVSTKSGVKSAWLLNEWAPELDGDQWAARVECR